MIKVLDQETDFLIEMFGIKSIPVCQLLHQVNCLNFDYKEKVSHSILPRDKQKLSCSTISFITSFRT